ncbi:MAG: hypothetical protein J5623_02280 [Clostridiales bacterium]|nr:hypothetical protein [Clostridiales bacterium]
MSSEANKKPDVRAEARLKSLYEKVFNEIADIDAGEFEENLVLGCLLPEELRALKESRIRYVTGNLAKFLIALMKTKELRKACLNAIENEKDLLDDYLFGSKNEYEAYRADTAAELPWEFKGTETFTVDLSVYDEEAWDRIASEINGSFESLDEYGKTLYEKTSLAFAEDHAKVSDMGYIAGNFMLVMLAMSDNDQFYAEIVNIMKFVNKVMTECWANVAQQLDWPEYDDYFDDEPGWTDDK